MPLADAFELAELPLLLDGAVDLEGPDKDCSSDGFVQMNLSR